MVKIGKHVGFCPYVGPIKYRSPVILLMLIFVFPFFRFVSRSFLAVGWGSGGGLLYLCTQSVAAGVTSLGSYAKSPEAQDVAASTVDVIGAISGAASSIGDAFKEAKKEFDDNTLSG